MAETKIVSPQISSLSASKLTTGTLASSLNINAPSTGFIGLNYNGGNSGIIVDDNTPALGIYSKNATKSIEVDNTSVRVNTGAGIIDMISSELRIYDSDNTQYVALKAPATGSLTTSYTLTLPTDDGTTGQVLSTNGTGTLSWITAGGSSSLSGLTAASATNTIDNLNFAQTWNWSTLSTQNALSVNADALTSGSLLRLLTNSASLNSTAGLLYVDNTGASTSGKIASIKSRNVSGSGLYILANGSNGFGTDAPTSPLSVSEQNTIAATASGDTVLHVSGLDGATNSIIQLDLHNAGANGPVFMGRHARGTVASPTATQSGDVLADYAGAGYGTAYGSLVGGMEIKAAQAFTGTAQGTTLSLSTTANATLTRTERLFIANDGVITIGNLGGGTAGAINASSTGVLSNSKVFITPTASASFITIANGSTLTTAANFTTSGAFALTLTQTAATNVTLPTTGTLATLAGAETLTTKRINPRVTSVANAAAPTPDVSTTDIYIMTGATGTVTFGVPAGTPLNGQRLTYRIKDNGTARTLAWNAIYRAMGVGLPLTTIAGKIMYIGLIYDADAVKWDVVSVSNEP